MVKGAHRNMMRKLVKATPTDIEADFQRCVTPGPCIAAGRQHHGRDRRARWPAPSTTATLSCRSGSACSRTARLLFEFFSGVVRRKASNVCAQKIKERLDRRHEPSMEQYDRLLEKSRDSGSGRGTPFRTSNSFTRPGRH
jgi:polyketide biosynthesis 3-hydroxy-3-methylglutaryl-CoA synthase-like enzyme PksG